MTDKNFISSWRGERQFYKLVKLKWDKISTPIWREVVVPNYHGWPICEQQNWPICEQENPKISQWTLKFIRRIQSTYTYALCQHSLCSFHILVTLLALIYLCKWTYLLYLYFGQYLICEVSVKSLCCCKQ